MATLSATRFNEPMRRYYRRLLGAGKPKKVALVATMRKLITLLNCLVKADRLWTVQPPRMNNRTVEGGPAT